MPEDMKRYECIREWGFVHRWETVIEAASEDEVAELFDQYCEENEPVIEALPDIDDEDWTELEEAQ